MKAILIDFMREWTRSGFGAAQKGLNNESAKKRCMCYMSMASVVLAFVAFTAVVGSKISEGVSQYRREVSPPVQNKMRRIEQQVASDAKINIERRSVAPKKTRYEEIKEALENLGVGNWQRHALNGKLLYLVDQVTIPIDVFSDAMPAPDRVAIGSDPLGVRGYFWYYDSPTRGGIAVSVGPPAMYNSGRVWTSSVVLD